MKRIKYVSAALLALCLLAAIILFLLPGTTQAANILYSGECGAEGDNLTWTLDDEGVTSIGDYAFYYCRSLASAVISGSVDSI